MEDVLFVADADRVAGIRASLVAGDDVGLLGEHVDDLPFPFVAPLGAEDHLDGHVVHRLRWCEVMNRGRSKKTPASHRDKVGDVTSEMQLLLLQRCDRLVDRRIRFEHRAELGDLDERRDLLGCAGELQVRRRRSSGAGAADEEAEPGTVHELDALQIDDDVLLSCIDKLVQLAVQCRWHRDRPSGCRRRGMTVTAPLLCSSRTS